jgi:uncharacterized protein
MHPCSVNPEGIMQPRELIDQIYADYARGDIDAVLDKCDHRISFFMVADPKFSKYAGAVVDKHGFRERAAALHENFEYLAVERIDTIAEGDRVVVRNEMHMRRRTSGIEFRMEVADFWTVREGKAVELVEFYDTALAAQVL